MKNQKPNRGLRIASLLTALLLLASLLVLPAAADTASLIDPPKSYYEMLTTQEGLIYLCLLHGIGEELLPESITLEPEWGISPDSLERAFAAFIQDHPEFFWVENAYSYTYNEDTLLSVKPRYLYSTVDEVLAATQELNAAVDMILADLPAGDNTTKALYLHDALARRVEYEKVGAHQTAYGALVSGKAVCAGYAAAYQLLMTQVGIPTQTVTGSSFDPSSGQAVRHAWNLVWLDETTCVYTDPTWDDQGDNIFHAYFQLSFGEMAYDHTVDTSLFELPACSHTDYGYFDRLPFIFNRDTSVETLAEFFGAPHDGVRTAAFWYDSDIPFSDWLNENMSELYGALGGLPGQYNCGYSVLGSEIILSVTGSFSTEIFNITLIPPSHTTASGGLSQQVAKGDFMEAVVLQAEDGWYFPEDYPLQGYDGLTVEWLNYKELLISGRPIADSTQSFAALSAQTPEPTPNVTFTATNHVCGILSGVADNMLYSYAESGWIPITVNGEIEVGMMPGTLLIKACGTGPTSDSEIQEIEILQHDKPDCSVTLPQTAGGTGSIATDRTHEYSTDRGETWADCNGPLTDLTPGTYHIRVKADGTTLASEALEVQLYASGTEPSENNTTGEESAQGTQQPNTDPPPSTSGDSLFSGCTSAVLSDSILLLSALGSMGLLLGKKRKS